MNCNCNGSWEFDRNKFSEGMFLGLGQIYIIYEDAEEVKKCPKCKKIHAGVCK